MLSDFSVSQQNGNFAISFLKDMNDIDIEITSKQSAALTNAGIERLNDMQMRTLDAFRKGGDIVILSPTGTGKTLAYLLPLLDILRNDICKLQAVVVLPTRELARQVADVWKLMSTGFHALCLHGGRSVNEEVASMKGDVPAVVFE